MSTPALSPNSTAPATPRTWLPRRLCVLTGLLFVLTLYAPLALRLAGLFKPDPKVEMRGLAQKPSLGLSLDALRSWEGMSTLGAALGRFPERMEAYYTDHLPLRSQLLTWHNRLLANTLGVSSFKDVVLGKDRWLFFDRERAVEQYRRARPLSDAHIEDWGEFLAEMHDWLAARGVRFLVVVCPNKETIYPELMPDRLNRLPGPEPTDQVLQYLSRTPVEVLDLRAAIRQARDEHRVFYRLDSHWNQYAALVAYREVAGRLARDFPAIKPKALADFHVVEDRYPPRDLAMMLRVDWNDQDIALVPKEPSRVRQVAEQRFDKQWTATVYEDGPATLPRAVVLHDSFFWSVAPLLKEEFSHSAWGCWVFDPKPEFIEPHRPALVIFQIVERRFMVPGANLTYLNAADFADSREVLLSTARLGQAVAQGAAQTSFVIPETPVPAGSRPVVELDLEVEVPGRVRLAFHQADGSGTAEHTRCRQIGQGRGKVYFKLPEKVVGPAVLTFEGMFGNTFVLHGLEVRRWSSRVGNQLAAGATPVPR